MVVLKCQDQYLTISYYLQTTTITATQSTTLVITPTPTWSTVRVTQTSPTRPNSQHRQTSPAPQTSPASDSAELTHTEAKQEPADILQYLDGFQMLRKYLETIQGGTGGRNTREDVVEDEDEDISEKETNSDKHNAPHIATTEPELETSKLSVPNIASSSLHTVYISGSVPGLYTSTVHTVVHSGVHQSSVV